MAAALDAGDRTIGKDSAVSDPLEYGERAYRAVLLIAIVAIIVCFFTFGDSRGAVFWAIGIGLAGIAFGAVASLVVILLVAKIQAIKNRRARARHGAR